MSEIISSFASYMANLGFEAGKGLINGKIDENRLKESLSRFIEQQQGYNELCSLAEEIDFQGLVDYIQDKMLNKAKEAIREVDSADREKAIKQIVDSAVSFSNAQSTEAKQRVERIITTCFNVIRAFYSDKIHIQDYLLADKAVDAVQKHTVKALSDSEKRIIERIDKMSQNSLGRVIESQQGDISLLNQWFKDAFQLASSSHPLQPYYRYGYKDGNLISQPAIPEANVAFPVHYMFYGPIRIGGKYITDTAINPLDLAYRHQVEIVMEIAQAKKYLCDFEDPASFGIKRMIGGELHVTPPEFPVPFPCSIKAGEVTYYEYILLRVQEILDDGTIIVSNKEQKTNIKFEFRIHNISIENYKQDRRNIDISLSISNETNREHLNYLRFIKALSEKEDIHVYVLDAGQDIIAGRMNCGETSGNSPSLDEKIDFLERICEIEDFFHVSIPLSGDMYEQDYRDFMYFSELVRKNEVESTWDKASFTGIVSPVFREKLDEMGSFTGALSYVGKSTVKLFGIELDVTFMRTFKSAKLNDYPRLCQLAKLLQDGEEIRIELIPDQNNLCVETLRIPGELGIISPLPARDEG